MEKMTMKRLIEKAVNLSRGTLMLTLAAGIAVVLPTACKQKKQTDDIVIRKVEEAKPQAPIRMQEYKQVKDFKWLDRDYQVNIIRMPDDSLRMVKDETGQKFVDNRIALSIYRSDGSLFFTKMFTKADFESQLNDDYRLTGILEGIVFDRVEDLKVFFAGSVCHPQTDEYIPFVITVSNLGDLNIHPDDDLDTSGQENDEEGL